MTPNPAVRSKSEHLPMCLSWDKQPCDCIVGELVEALEELRDEMDSGKDGRLIYMSMKTRQLIKKARSAK